MGPCTVLSHAAWVSTQLSLPRTLKKLPSRELSQSSRQ
jgi:hypothetical protein